VRTPVWFIARVIPAQAGIHASVSEVVGRWAWWCGLVARLLAWVPAFVLEARLRHDAGM